MREKVQVKCIKYEIVFIVVSTYVTRGPPGGDATPTTPPKLVILEFFIIPERYFHI